jgi:hypothetical protein
MKTAARHSEEGKCHLPPQGPPTATPLRNQARSAHTFPRLVAAAMQTHAALGSVVGGLRPGSKVKGLRYQLS